MTETHSLSTNPLHIAHGHATAQPEFAGGMEWYMAYGDRHDADGPTGMLVSQFTFTENWDSWEMHPVGDEVVLCLSGEITLHRKHGDGATDSVTLTAGRYAINPPGCWHTADIAAAATCLFMTTGRGTEHRLR